MPGKKKLGKFWNEKARAQLLSGVVVALMSVAAMSGLFLMSERASAATVVSEDFEDISDWTQTGTQNVVLNDTITHTGTYSAKVNVVTATDTQNIRNTFTGFADTSATLKFYFYLDSSPSTKELVAGIWNTSISNDFFYFAVSDTGYAVLRIKDEGTSTDYISTNTTISTGIWHEIILVADTGTAKLYVDGNLAVSHTYTSGDTIDRVDVGDVGTANTDDYFVDDLIVTNTADYPSSNTPPTVSITSPADSATVSGTVNITGTAADSDGTVQSVEVKIDSGSWQTATGTTSWYYLWDSTGVSDGSHTIYARSYDGTDYSTEDSVTITVDNVADVAPSVALSGLTSGEVTWNGTDGSVVWCNSSGSGTETVVVTITGGSGTLDGDVDQVNLTFSDLSGGSGTIPDTNLTVYASVDQSTWHSFGSPSSHMVYLNATTWTWTDDPFPITGDDTIYLRFKLAIGGDEGEYTATGWKVAIAGQAAT